PRRPPDLAAPRLAEVEVPGPGGGPSAPAPTWRGFRSSLLLPRAGSRARRDGVGGGGGGPALGRERLVDLVWMYAASRCRALSASGCPAEGGVLAGRGTRHH